MKIKNNITPRDIELMEYDMEAERLLSQLPQVLDSMDKDELSEEYLIEYVDRLGEVAEHIMEEPKIFDANYIKFLFYSTMTFVVFWNFLWYCMSFIK